MLYKLTTFSFLIVFCVLTGCSPKTTTVTGTVTLNGKGLQDISVLLQPVSGSDSSVEAAFGKTNQQGQFSLSSLFSKKHGVFPGEYLVFISWVDPNPMPENEPQNPCPYSIPVSLTNGSVRQCIEIGQPQKLVFEFSHF